MIGPNGFAADQKFLIEFFARAHPDNLNRDFTQRIVGVADRSAAQSNHPRDEFLDLYWLAHVQNKDLSTACHCARLDYQLNRLFDCHEIPRDVRMGQRDRPAAFDLASKQRYCRSGGPEDVAKADHRENGILFLPFSGLNTSRRLNDQFGHSLRRSHHVCWAHCLIRRYKDKILHPGARRCACEIPCPEDIVSKSLHGIMLNDRHVFVCSSVIHGVHAIAFKQRVCGSWVRERTEDELE